MTRLLANTKITKLMDRDDRSDPEVQELRAKNIKVLSKRHLEAYLLDDSIIQALCVSTGHEDKYEECIKKKHEALQKCANQGKPTDDIKSARGEIYVSLKQVLGLRQCGNTADAFLRDTMAPLIKPHTEIYKQLEREIFGGETNA